MELPSELVLEILAFLTVKDLYLKVAYLSYELHQLTRTPQFISSLLYRDIKYSLDLPDIGQSRRLLRNARCYEASKRLVDFYGFATSGGVDVDMTYLWVRNMFEISERGYSTQEDAFNVNCAAVLQNALNPRNVKQEAFEFLKRLQGVLGVEVTVECESVIDILISLTNLRSLLTLDHRDLFNEYVNHVQHLMSHASPNLFALTKANFTELHLTEQINLEVAESSRLLCCIHGLQISRKGPYTCPVASLVVLCSDSYISVQSQDFDRFNNLTSPAQVKLAHEMDSSVPDSYPETTTEEYCYLEFKPTHGPLWPILWMRFSPNSLEEVSIELRRRYTCKFLYVKLIDAENRMEARGWVHDRMNIDVTHVLVQGNLIDLA